ncbi:TolC family protein [Caulobacter vibrioides]|uniref:TolC family protein n=1 Tax=Caulobacter vibrioides TaxID=155892 RepID=UPI002101AAC1|nr:MULTISPECIES: TolC family protein [Caulobacter]
MRQATQTAPRLKEAQAGVREAQGLALQAQARPNPVVGLEAENFGGKAPYNGTNQAETTLSVAQALELGGKRSARVSAANAEVTAAEARNRQASADFAYELAVAYAAAEAAQARADLAAQALKRSQDDLGVSRALVDAGREANLRLVTAQAAEASARADAEAARADAVEALARLSALAGVAEPYTSLAGGLLSAPASPSTADGVPPADMPALQVARAEREAAGKQVTVERRRAIPDLTASVGVRRLNGQGLTGNDSTALVAGVSVPFPLFDQNRGNVAAASARANAADARFEEARLRAEADWRSARVQADAAVSRVSASQQSEAAADEAYRLARVGYESGKTPLVEVLNAQRALTDARRTTLDARVARVRAQATLARLAGRAPFGE